MDKAVLARSSAFMLKKYGADFLKHQISCGCECSIWPQPVSLEPEFIPFGSRSDRCTADITYQSTPELVKLGIWISPEHVFKWDRAELFIKQLSALNTRAGFEIVGNCKRICLNILCAKSDLPIIEAAFRGRLRKCRLSICPSDENILNAGHEITFRDYYPTPPFYRLLTCNDELKVTPFEVLVSALNQIEPPGVGIYQVIFQPVQTDHNWHENIKRLFDMEYMVRLADNPGLAARNPQQLPSAPLGSMAGVSECKAHNDKPLFAAAVRLAATGDDAGRHIVSLGSFMNLFQHGGRQLDFLEKEDYLRHFSLQQIADMLENATIYRPGFLVNSFELCGLVHVPPDNIFEGLETQFDNFHNLSDVPDDLDHGLIIGSVNAINRIQNVCLNPGRRTCHCHMIGKPHMGKSTLIENMAISDITCDEGIAVIDPHGDLADKLLYLIPEDYVEKVIYIDFSDPNWIPIWNPMHCLDNKDISRTTNDLIGVFKSFVTGWGDRMEHLLRHSIFGLMHLPGTSLLDVANILRKGKASQDNIKMILEVIESQEARQFWLNDFRKYSSSDLGPPKHKLSKLLLGGTVADMFSQSESYFSFEHIMDSGKILIVNLAGVGPETRNVLGAFMVALMHVTALGRSKVAKNKRRPFHIYLDEAHRFVTDSLENIIAETRKYNVDLTLAHQYFKQFDTEVADALCSVGTTIAFNVDYRDAIMLSKAFQKKVEPEEFGNLSIGQAFVRSGRHMVKIDTPGPIEIRDKNCYQQIIDNSRSQYYKHISQIRQSMARCRDRFDEPFANLPANRSLFERSKSQSSERFNYDRL